jgi:tetratricopeptide (TPR) repeat protein
MKKILLALFLLGIPFQAGIAAKNDTLLDQANRAYKQGNYAEAMALYETIASEYKDPLVYYNLGNAAYKAGQLAKAVLAYERVLKIRPLMADAAFNLRIAKQSLLDKERAEENPFIRAADFFVRSIPLDGILLLLALGLFFVVVIKALLVAGYTNKVLSALRSAIPWFGLLLLILSFLAVTSLFHSAHVKEAVVMTEEVSLKVMPHENAAEAFVLHQGAKVRILESDGAWYLVRFGKDKEGKPLQAWIDSRNIEKI